MKYKVRLIAHSEEIIVEAKDEYEAEEIATKNFNGFQNYDIEIFEVGGGYE